MYKRQVYVHFAEGFEEVEAVTIVDLLRRAAIDVKMVSIMEDKMVEGAHGMQIQADLLFEEADYDGCDMIVLPGGMPGALHLKDVYKRQDLLQAGHHGSSTSNSYYFLREANPEYVVISCGKGNMYGHPHEEALSRFRDLGAEVFRTDEQGTIIAVDDGMQITFNCEGKKSDRTHVKDYEDASYIGNINSKKYHLPSCSGLDVYKRQHRS